MRILVEIEVVLRCDLAALMVEQGEHTVKARADPRRAEVEDEHLSGGGRETEMVVIAGKHPAIDDYRQPDQRNLGPVVVWFGFHLLRQRANIEDLYKRALQRNNAHVTPANH